MYNKLAMLINNRRRLDLFLATAEASNSSQVKNYKEQIQKVNAAIYDYLYNLAKEGRVYIADKKGRIATPLHIKDDDKL